LQKNLLQTGDFEACHRNRFSKQSIGWFFSDTLLSPGYNPGPDLDSMSQFDQQVKHLEKQLDIESKVKQGADQVVFKTM